MTVPLPRAEPRENPISGTNSSVQQPRRLALEKTAYYYPRYRGNGWKLRDLQNNECGEIGYDS